MNGRRPGNRRVVLEPVIVNEDEPTADEARALRAEVMALRAEVLELNRRLREEEEWYRSVLQQEREHAEWERRRAQRERARTEWERERRLELELRLDRLRGLTA